MVKNGGILTNAINFQIIIADNITKAVISFFLVIITKEDRNAKLHVFDYLNSTSIETINKK